MCMCNISGQTNGHPQATKRFADTNIGISSKRMKREEPEVVTSKSSSENSISKDNSKSVEKDAAPLKTRTSQRLR